MIKSMKYGDCWAKLAENKKSGMAVEQHCRIVGYVARELLGLFSPSVRCLFPECTVSVAALHDIGKVSPGFQKKLSDDHVRDVCPELADQSNSGFEKYHAKTGAAAVQRFLQRKFGSSAIAEIVGAHHGGESRNDRNDTGEIYGGLEWAAERKELVKSLVQEFGEISDEKLDYPIKSALSGLVSVADWIGSDEECFPAEGLKMGGAIPDEAKKAVADCGWHQPKMNQDLSFEDIFNFAPYPAQKRFIDMVDEPGLYILEAPMGLGKTEAALYAAYKLMAAGHNQGLYFALPTRLTSDRIHERVNQFLDKICGVKESARLAHGTAWQKAYEHGGKEFRPGKSWFNPRKRTLLYPFGVGTIDQALLAVLKVKHNFVRSFGLAGKVVILDEVHSYDIYTGTLLVNLVRHLLDLKCTVIVLSATLTGSRRNELIGHNQTVLANDYPLITKASAGKIHLQEKADPPAPKGYEISLEDWDSRAVAKRTVAKALEGCCVLCIANTVGKAQEWFDAVKAEMPEGRFEVGLLHSKFPVFRREELEENWLDRLGKNPEKRPIGCVLVATQVVEQSVDIDADFMITELAPTDMLLQRIGRVWRHTHKRTGTIKPEVVIVSGIPDGDVEAAFGKSNCKVYQPYVLWRTWQIWKDLRQIVLPDNIRGLLEKTYCEKSETLEHIEALKRGLKESQERLKKFANAVGAEVLGVPVGEDNENACTRYNDRPMQNILLIKKGLEIADNGVRIELLDGKGALQLRLNEKDFLATIRLHRCVLSVPRYVIKKLRQNDNNPTWLKMHFYDKTPVWEWDDISGLLTWNGKETGYTYDHTRGLQRAADTGATWQHVEEDSNDDDFYDD